MGIPAITRSGLVLSGNAPVLNNVTAISSGINASSAFGAAAANPLTNPQSIASLIPGEG